MFAALAPRNVFAWLLFAPKTAIFGQNLHYFSGKAW
jgi:hypothetical protein